MRSHLANLLSQVPPAVRRSLAREYLQIYLLRLLHEAQAHSRLAFVGGTALRLLHGLPRYSEDLDFCAAPQPGDDPLDLAATFASVGRGLVAAGYRIKITAKAARAVSHALYRFEGLPRELGWSTDARVALSIKIEVDTAPPAGARLETTLVQRFFPVALRHHDMPSLFAGKLHALLARSFAKGRDWYDLVWYLTEQRGIEPNRVLLANALAQSGHDPGLAGEWRAALRARLRQLDWRSVAEDAAPFLERPSDLEQMTPDLVAKLL